MTANHDLSELFAAERAVRPPALAAARGLERLLASVSAQAVPVAVIGGAGKLSWAVVCKWILGGFVIGVAGSGAAGKLWAPAAALPPTQAAVVATASIAMATEPSPSATLPMPAMTADEKRGEARRVASASPTPTEGMPTFDAELRLISHAKAGLDTLRPHLARVWLGEHAVRFPNGVFATEREALLVLAACAEQANPALARGFVSKHPSSPLRERLERACHSGRIEESLNEKAPDGEPTAE